MVLLISDNDTSCVTYIVAMDLMEPQQFKKRQALLDESETFQNYKVKDYLEGLLQSYPVKHFVETLIHRVQFHHTSI